MEVFEDAIKDFGIPSRIRGDRGGENVKLSVWMIKKRGPNRASFMWGRYCDIATLVNQHLNSWFLNS